MLGHHDRAYLIDLGGCRLTINGQLRLEGAHTPGYCPLETTLAQMTITAAADSYTAGSTLFHLLTGKAPLSFLPDVIRSTDEHAVRPESWDWALLEQKASPPTCALVRRCLDPVASNRPADGAALYDEINRLLGSL
jgi:serine/threonine protein kinase